VFSTVTQPNRKSLVDLSNDRWTGSELARAKALCARLTVDGYDAFHLHETSSNCLRYHFHQKNPDTLANYNVRSSFVFGNMVPGANPTSWLSFFISSANATDTSDNSTIHGTQVRSWIRNFVYQPNATCISVHPQIPDDAVGLHLQVVNHGTNLTPQPHDWIVNFID
jgi:hypothetical protein